MFGGATTDYMGQSDYSLREGGSAVVKALVNAMLDPIGDSSPMRLPDRGCAPTATFRYVTNWTRTVTNTSTDGSNILFALQPTQSVYDTFGPLDSGANYVATPSVAASAVLSPYAYSPGNICSGVQYDDPTAGFVMIDGSAPRGPWDLDFGEQQQTTTQWMAGNRTLSGCLRVRITGYPDNTFLPGGICYSAHVPMHAGSMPLTEQDFIELERLGLASHVSLGEVQASGSKTQLLIPHTEEALRFNSSFFPPCGMFYLKNIATGTGSLPLPVPAQQFSGTRLYPGFSEVSAASGAIKPSQLFIPYDTVNSIPGGAQGVNGAADSLAARTLSVLVVAFFGVKDGTQFELSAALNGEYTTKINTPSGVVTEVMLPDSNAVDRLFCAAAVLNRSMPRAFAMPGDVTVSGGTAEGRVVPHVAVRSLRGLAEAVVNKKPVALPGRRPDVRSMRQPFTKKAHSKPEGFWDFDWLSRGSFGNPSEKGGSGFGWKF